MHSSKLSEGLDSQSLRKCSFYKNGKDKTNAFFLKYANKGDLFSDCWNAETMLIKTGFNFSS